VDSREFGAKAFWVTATLCALLVLADLFYTKHGHYAVEQWFGFHGWYGFVSCMFLVIAAKQLRRLLKRDEDYYD